MYRDFKYKPRLLFLLVILVFLGCSKYTDQPIFNLSVSDRIHIKDDFPLFDIENYRHSGIVLYEIDINPQILDVAKLNNGHYLIYDNLDERLYYWDKKDTAQLFAVRGMGPNDIESGFRLERIDGENYLLQRARRSEIICNELNNCELQAVQTFDNLVSYYEKRNTGITVSIENFIPDKGRIRVVANGDTRYTGGYYEHPDPELQWELNLSVLIPLANFEGYIQIFSLSPHIIYLNYDLEVVNVFALESFDKIEITSNRNRGNIDYEFNFREGFSQVVWFYEMQDGDIIFVIRHAFEVPRSAIPMDYEMVTKQHDYYKFNIVTKNLEYIGSSENYTIPLDRGFLVIQDYMLQYYEPIGNF